MNAMVVVVVIGIVALVALGAVLGSHAGGPPGPNAASRRPEVAARSGRRKSSVDVPGIGVVGADGGTSCGWGGGDSGGGDGGGATC
jgi:hypothetical protein